MITMRQIERSWSSQHFSKLLQDLLEARPEAGLRIDTGRIQLLSAAMAVIRLDEIEQQHSVVYPHLLGHIISVQEGDGGWGDLTISAVCLRALMTSGGAGAVIERGLQYLANLQQLQGAWPREPIRRMPADAYTTAFILFQLARHPAFRDAVRFESALDWFSSNGASLDDDTRRLWGRASLRCGQKPMLSIDSRLGARRATLFSETAELSLSKWRNQG